MKLVLYVIATDPGTITTIQGVGLSVRQPGSFQLGSSTTPAKQREKRVRRVRSNPNPKPNLNPNRLTLTVHTTVTHRSAGAPESPSWIHWRTTRSQGDRSGRSRSTERRWGPDLRERGGEAERGEAGEGESRSERGRYRSCPAAGGRGGGQI